jgi:O-antigen ligase
VFAQCGTVGLVGIMGTLLLPVAVFIRRFPASQWQEAAVAPAAALAVVVILYAIDDLANGSINPVFMLASGGLAGLRCERLACCAKS